MVMPIPKNEYYKIHFFVFFSCNMINDGKFQADVSPYVM